MSVRLAMNLMTQDFCFTYNVKGNIRFLRSKMSGNLSYIHFSGISFIMLGNQTFLLVRMA